MQVWANLLVVIQLLAAAAMIGLVLLQHGKGADMGASFGSGASGSLFGATGSASFLSRSTAICATVFFAATLGLSVVNNRRAEVQPTSAPTVFDRAPVASAPLAASGVPMVSAVSASGVALPSSAAASAALAPASGAPVIPQR